MDKHHPPYKGYLFTDDNKGESLGHYHPSGDEEAVKADLPHRAGLLGAKYGELYRLDSDGKEEKKPFALFIYKGASDSSAKSAKSATVTAAGKADEAPTGPRWRAHFFKDSSKKDVLGTCYPSGDEEAVKADLAHRAELLGAKYGVLYQLDEEGKEGKEPFATFPSSSGSPEGERKKPGPKPKAPAPAAEAPAAEEASSAAENAPSSSRSTPAAPARGRKPSAPPAAPKKKPGRKPSNPPKK